MPNAAPSNSTSSRLRYLPHQDEQRLLPAGQRPGSPPGAPCAALGTQPRRHVADQFSGDVEHGTIGNHVEPSPLERSCGETSLRGLHAQPPDCPNRTEMCVSPESTCKSW